MVNYIMSDGRLYNVDWSIIKRLMVDYKMSDGRKNKQFGALNLEEKCN